MGSPKTLVLKCHDKWSDNIVVLHCFESSVYTVNLSLQKCRGLMIADVLQRMSDNFPKINDIYYSDTPYKGYYNFIINREYMGE